MSATWLRQRGVTVDVYRDLKTGGEANLGIKSSNMRGVVKRGEGGGIKDKMDTETGWDFRG